MSQVECAKCKTGVWPEHSATCYLKKANGWPGTSRCSACQPKPAVNLKESYRICVKTSENSTEGLAVAQVGCPDAGSFGKVVSGVQQEPIPCTSVALSAEGPRPKGEACQGVSVQKYCGSCCCQSYIDAIRNSAGKGPTCRKMSIRKTNHARKTDGNAICEKLLAETGKLASQNADIEQSSCEDLCRTVPTKTADDMCYSISSCVARCNN